MAIRCWIFALASPAIVLCAEPRNFCQPPPEVEKAFQQAAAASAAITDPFAALDRAAPFQAVRDRYPDNLFAHERYEDAIHENGIEGHLRLLARQYAELESQHAGDPMYRYLSLRATVGRSTAAAIAGLHELLAKNPGFAPAHRTLGEIYGTEAFRQPEQEDIEKETFLALCPGGSLTRRPPAVPGPSRLIDEAARLLDQNGETDRIIAMTIQGLKEFEWRSQRIRAFDWYSRDYKLQDARDLRARYWQAWPVQVRAYQKAGRVEEANTVLASMELRAKALRNQPGSADWDALEVLVQLYTEVHQAERAAGKFRELEQLLGETQGPDQRTLRAARLERLRSLVNEDPASRGGTH
ncbi:MAG TPA: hypothetical protein VN841_20230 [Bryobacteraceae bacterium]|nr:hypothetical protein [Bryobacteraceae bacterium]